jgi:hypothetical protein
MSGSAWFRYVANQTRCRRGHCSESVLLELGVESGDLLITHGLGASGHLLLLEDVELLGLDLALLFEAGNEVLAGPAGHSGEVTEGAELSVRLQSEHLEGLGNDDALLVVVGEGNSLEDLKAAESGGALRGLVGEHSTDHLPEHAGGSLPVLESTAGVGVDAVVHISLAIELVAEQRARNVDGLSADNNDALAVQKLLSENAGEAAHKVGATVDNNLLFEHA